MTDTIKLPIEIELTAKGEWDFDPETGEKWRTGDSLSETIVVLAAEKLLSRYEEALVKRLEKLVDGRIKERVEALVEQEVARILAEGWQTYTRYGDPTGERATLKNRVMEMINGAEKKKGCGAKAKSLLDEAVEKNVAVFVDRALLVELKEARTKMRKQLDDTIKLKLAEVLKGALNL